MTKTVSSRIGLDEMSSFDVKYLSRGARLALTSLQGLANRGAPRIYLSYGGDEIDWLADRIYSGRTDFQGRTIYTDVETMIADYKDLVGVQGVVIWDPTRPFTINAATNLAGVYNLLMFTPDMLPIATSLGLTVQYDLRYLWNNPLKTLAQNIYDSEAWTYNTLITQQSQDWLANYYYAWPSDGRDFAIQHKIHVFWLPGNGPCSDGPDPEYSYNLQIQVQYIMQHHPKNIPILGFWEADDDSDVQGHQRRGFCEADGVKLAGEYGKLTLVTGPDANYSFHSQMPYDVNTPPSATPYDPSQLRQTAVRSKQTQAYDPQKKYVALLMQESGDSPAYIQYAFRSTHWDDPERGQVPLSYGITPQLLSLMPAAAQYFFNSATENDYFYSSISGLGYTAPLMGLPSGGYGYYGVMAPGTSTVTYNQPQILQDYFQRSGSAMRDMDLDMLGLSTTTIGNNPAVQVWDYSTWDPFINTWISPNIPGLTAIVSDMGRLDGMKGWNSGRLMARQATLFDTLTAWPGVYPDTTPQSVSNDWFLNADTTLSAPYDEAAVNWLANDIRQHSTGTHFIQAMALSWFYGPHRLSLLQQQLQPEGYVFVTMSEFNQLWRQSKTLPPADPDPYNKSGLHAATQEAVELPLGKTALASGIWNNDQSGAFAPPQAVDGDLTTYWASNNDGYPSNLLIDLGDMRLIKHAYILWQSGGTYKIQVSLDRVNWSQIATGTVASHAWSVNDFSSGWWARYVKISPASSSGNQYRAIYHVDLRDE